jgi:anti-sigma B factor antagonist
VTILDVETVEGDGLVKVVLRGELDLSTVGKLEEELRRVEAGAPPILVLDLAGLSFLDSTGLRLVVTADQRAREQGRRLAIRKGPETVQRVFTITRLDERLEMVDDLSTLTESR